jgi:mRNA deadenylase 3'-5' endonuclease subunit Ccr4
LTTTFNSSSVLDPQLNLKMLPAKNPSGAIPPLIDDFAPFSVLQYNMLSNSDVSHNSLDWRGQAITDFLLQHNADVLCLQEVYTDWFQKILQPKLGKAGYKGHYAPRGEQLRFHALTPGDRPDGCAIFYKTDRFVGKDFEAQQFRHALFEKGQRRFGTSDVFSQRMLGPGHIIQVALLDLVPTKENYNQGTWDDVCLVVLC